MKRASGEALCVGKGLPWGPPWGAVPRSPAQSVSQRAGRLTLGPEETQCVRLQLDMLLEAIAGIACVVLGCNLSKAAMRKLLQIQRLLELDIAVL